MNTALFENLRLELRRGCLVVAVLAALRTEQYGYTLRKLFGDHGLAVERGQATRQRRLRSFLRMAEPLQHFFGVRDRLEELRDAVGLLVSEWREEGKRN